ncbi:MAG: large-conductance mechanosensitive channel protein MscL [Nitrospirae bacterium]|nr:large-conductance mechanosensitive channel protein MscL [Nitrospirota bacterium]
MIREFKEFAMRGNVLDMAVGIIIGASFGTIIASLVSDILMPPIGLLLGGVDFSNLFLTIKEGATAGPFSTLADAQKAGAVTINYGMFVNKVVSFAIVAFAVFMVVKGVNSLKKKEAPPAAPATKDCSFCYTAIPVKATRCPHCTSELGAGS